MRYLNGFSYLKLGNTYKHICDTARKHHKPYLPLFKSCYEYLPEVDEFNYTDERGNSKIVWRKEVLLTGLCECSKFGENRHHAGDPNIKEVDGAIIFSKDIVVKFNLLFFRDSLVKIAFYSDWSEFAKSALEKKYGEGTFTANIDKPGVKTDISEYWENDVVSAHYREWAKWEEPHRKLRDCWRYLTITHKILDNRMYEYKKRLNEAKAAAKSAERSAIMEKI